MESVQALTQGVNLQTLTPKTLGFLKVVFSRGGCGEERELPDITFIFQDELT